MERNNVLFHQNVLMLFLSGIIKLYKLRDGSAESSGAIRTLMDDDVINLEWDGTTTRILDLCFTADSPAGAGT